MGIPLMAADVTLIAGQLNFHTISLYHRNKILYRLRARKMDSLFTAKRGFVTLVKERKKELAYEHA